MIQVGRRMHPDLRIKVWHDATPIANARLAPYRGQARSRAQRAENEPDWSLPANILLHVTSYRCNCTARTGPPLDLFYVLHLSDFSCGDRAHLTAPPRIGLHCCSQGAGQGVACPGSGELGFMNAGYRFANLDGEGLLIGNCPFYPASRPRGTAKNFSTRRGGRVWWH